MRRFALSVLFLVAFAVPAEAATRAGELGLLV